MSNYTELLKDPRWQKKRLEILNRDEWSCYNCGDNTKTLHVHHKYYLKGAMPWEYSNKALITLCEICHEAEEKAIKENMSLFVDGFRKSEFMATDLANLLEGIAEIKLQHLHEVVASAYQYAFSSPEMQALIIEKYFINLKKTSNARYQDSQV